MADASAMNVRLSKDERYYIFDPGDGDLSLPRVSTILDHSPKPGLEVWKRKVGFEEADRISREATTFGSAVHALTERIDLGDDGWLSDGAWEDEPIDLRPWGRAWVAFKAAHVEEIVYVEKFLYSRKHGYAGTCDRVAVMKKTHHTAILDIKTSKYPSDDYGVQCAAYYGALYEMEGLRVQERIAVFLPSNRPGQYALDYFDDLRDDWAEFLRRRDSWRRSLAREDYWKKRLRFVKCDESEEAA